MSVRECAVSSQTIECPPGVYILDAAEKQGVNLPFDCRLGACVACAAKVEAGTVNDVEQVILSRTLRALINQPNFGYTKY